MLSRTVLALGACSCAVAVSFDEYGTTEQRRVVSPKALYAVSGTVSGLANTKVSLVLDGAYAIEVGDGSFTFPPVLEDGASFVVSVVADPRGHRCVVDRGDGASRTIAAADATGVTVVCTSTISSLAGLELGIAPLSPTFDSARLLYTATTYSSGIFDEALPSTTLTATASDPRARISVRGALVSSGSATRAFELLPGANAFDIDVTAVDKSKTSYAVQTTLTKNAYLKASNTRRDAYFSVVAVDGDTLAVGSWGESSKSTGVNGDASDTSMPEAGAVYVFTRTGTTWSQQAYLKASNTRPSAHFGRNVALSGNTLVVGAPDDPTTAARAGSAYVFVRSGATWSQQAHLRAGYPRADGVFGSTVAIAGDTIAVGSYGESSAATGIDGDETNATLPYAGAVFVFVRTAGNWARQAYLKASNTRTFASFGAIGLSGDTLAVGAPGDPSGAAGVDGDPFDTSTPNAGAVFVFTRTGAQWSPSSYLKASNPRRTAHFGASVKVFGDTIGVGSPDETSGATGVDGDQTNATSTAAGAAYVFARSGNTWSQQAYLKASNTRASAIFGAATAIGQDTFVVGASGDSSRGTHVDGDQTDGALPRAGAAFVFTRSGTTWSQRAFVKASNTAAQAFFGASVALSGKTLVVGATGESSAATGVGGNQMTGNGAPYAGAVYVY